MLFGVLGVIVASQIIWGYSQWNPGTAYTTVFQIQTNPDSQTTRPSLGIE